MILLLLAAATAQATIKDPSQIACYRTAHSRARLDQCDREALARAEQTLSLYWGNTLAEYADGNPRSVDLLKQSQTQWLSYRDAWCEVVAHDNHGSNPSTKAACQAKLTRARIEVIKSLIAGTNE